MTAGGGIRVWTSGSGQPPPEWGGWMRSERLLWAAAVPESAKKSHYRRLAVTMIILVAIIAYFIPFGETVAEYCERSGRRRCVVHYWGLWLVSLVFLFEFFRSTWSFLRADSVKEPNLYAITTRRVLVRPRSRPDLLQYRPLAGCRVRLGPWNESILFGGSLFRSPLWFDGLGRDLAFQAVEIVRDAMPRE